MVKYFKFEEFTKSAKAKELNIDNTPKDETIINNINEVMEVMDIIRTRWTEYCADKHLQNPQIKITSGYRCDALNKAVKGSKTSAHKIGSAADYKAVNGHNKALYKVSQKVLEEMNIPYDQLINEYDYSWTHLGLKNLKGEQRKQVFAIK